MFRQVSLTVPWMSLAFFFSTSFANAATGVIIPISPLAVSDLGCKWGVDLSGLFTLLGVAYEY
jgi:hypothetical protein